MQNEGRLLRRTACDCEDDPEVALVLQIHTHAASWEAAAGGCRLGERPGQHLPPGYAKLSLCARISPCPYT
jgi:hypothetical protein